MIKPTRKKAVAQKGAHARKPGLLGNHDKRLAAATLMALIASGLHESQVIEEMGLSSIKQYNEIKRWMYELEEPQHVGKTDAQLFIDYVIAQRGCLNELNQVITQYKKSKQGNALVGAIRAKSDIYDKIVRRGEELGVLRKQDGVIKVVAGINVDGMTKVDIAIRVEKDLRDIQQITGATDIIDVTPEDAAVPVIRKKKVA